MGLISESTAPPEHTVGPQRTFTELPGPGRPRHACDHARVGSCAVPSSPRLPVHPALNRIHASEQLTPHFCVSVSPALPLTSALCPLPSLSFVPDCVTHLVAVSTHSFSRQKSQSMYDVPGVETEGFGVWIENKAISVDTLGLFACDLGGRRRTRRRAREAEGRTCSSLGRGGGATFWGGIPTARLPEPESSGRKGARAVGTARAAATLVCQSQGGLCNHTAQRAPESNEGTAAGKVSITPKGGPAAPSRWAAPRQSGEMSLVPPCPLLRVLMKLRVWPPRWVPGAGSGPRRHPAIVLDRAT